MTAEEFNKWCDEVLPIEIPKLVKQYPRCGETIHDTVSDFYVHVVTKRLEELRDPLGYLYGYVYNRYYRFFTDMQKGDMMVFRKQLKILLTEDLPDIEEEEDTYNEILDKVAKAVSSLPLYDQNLFELYYIKKNSVAKIGQMVGVSHNAIHKRIKKLRQKVKDILCLTL